MAPLDLLGTSDLASEEERGYVRADERWRGRRCSGGL